MPRRGTAIPPMCQNDEKGVIQSTVLCNRLATAVCSIKEKSPFKEWVGKYIAYGDKHILFFYISMYAKGKGYAIAIS